MSKGETAGILTTVVVGLAIMILPVIGYVSNIVKLCHCDFQAPYKAEVVRGVGVAIPVVGMVTGYMKIKDGE